MTPLPDPPVVLRRTCPYCCKPNVRIDSYTGRGGYLARHARGPKRGLCSGTGMWLPHVEPEAAAE